MLDLAADQHSIGERLAPLLSEDLASMGLSIPKFIISNISLPPEVEAALDKRTQMGLVGDMNQYSQFQAANAMEAAANNPSGGAGEGLGLGMGIAAGQQMAQALNPNQQAPQQQAPQQQAAPPAAAAPPPLPQADQWYLGVGGQQLGPFDVSGLSAQVSAGNLTASTLVWKAQMAAWTPAGQVPELAQVLAASPPPLPPPTA